MEENGRLIKFLYNEDREVVAEETSNGTITRYIRGLGIISSDSEEAKTYYHYVSDEQGSITHVLSEDAEILNHYSYDAFGNIIQKTEKVENRFCYNGEMLDPVTRQYYLRARFYNPVIGRFTQEDTYYGDGLNLYQYCQANPIGYVDPSGHTCEIVQNHYEQYQEYRKQHPRATAADAYKAVTGKDPLKKDNNKGSNKVDFYVTPDGDVIPNGTCVAIGLPREPSNLRTASQLQADADAIHSAIVTSSGAPDIKAQTNRTTTVTQGYDSKGNVIHTITNSSGVVTGNQKAVARSIYGDDVVIPTKSKVPPSNNTNSHHGEQQGIRITNNQTGRVQASSSGAKHGGAACGPCSIAQVEAGVVNVTGVQVKVGGNGRRFPK